MFRIGANRGAAAVPLTAKLPWAYFAEQGIVFLKFGGFMRTLRFRGGDADSMSETDLVATMRRLHDALRRVRGQMSLHIEAQRRPASPYPGADLGDRERRALWPDPISFLFDEERRTAYDRTGSQFETDRYITFVWRCSRASTRRARSFFMSGKKKAGKAGSAELHEFVQASNAVKGMLDGVMKECAWLDDDDTFDFLHKAVSVHQHRVKPSYGKARIDYDVADCRVVGGAEPMLGPCHMRTISVKNSPDTIPAALAALDSLRCEYRYSIRWMGMEHAEGLRRIEQQLRDWRMLGIAMIPMLISYMLRSNKQKENEAANAMAEDAQEAIYAVRRDDLTIGHATINVVVWDRDEERLERKVGWVEDTLRRQQLTVTSYTVAPLDTWLGTLPGHIYADLRRPIRTSVNLAHFAPYSSVWSGEVCNDHLSRKLGRPIPPLLIATTDGSTPFRLNLHRGDLGHTLIFGPSGNGKTTLMNAMITGWRRIPGSKVCIFTIKGGGEVVTRLLGGVSYDVGAVGPGALGFQPLRYADEPNERIELLEWVLGLMRAQGIDTNSAVVKEEATGALDLIARNPPERRTLTHLSGYLTTEVLKRAVRHYALAGDTYGRLLDDDRDRIELSDILSLDMTSLLKKTDVAPHVLAHLFRYVERRVFTGDPVLLVVDEAWLFLGDSRFAAKFDEWLRAARSKNVVVVFATQNMKDAFDSVIGKVLADAENVPNIILLPNHRAGSEKGRKPYEQLGFHERDIEIVATATPKRDYYFTCPDGARLFDLGLGPLGRALCSSTDTKDDLGLARGILADHPAEEFAEHFLDAKGVGWAAEFVRHEAGRRPVEIAAAAE
ncbi:hypothetical protein IGS68_34850 (plasmid) [Skermanella sp. TT6]|uniref:AAA+ ATPase domain-containing protein n=1 Tax=Skermanella cutis TaxID=2775420 RepID=A0ABX7BLF6_9PROT|nr:hypothetical protein [Skermanella sp. TT6]QQP94024.1 hypothetical protein IGS68_34850 [Skermanella sp. TT6]